jgi:hypothetical protein
MGYSLWKSEDASYTLGHRMGRDRDLTPETETTPADAAASRPSREELDHIDFLMETLARKLESNAA